MQIWAASEKEEKIFKFPGEMKEGRKKENSYFVTNDFKAQILIAFLLQRANMNK